MPDTEPWKVEPTTSDQTKGRAIAALVKLHRIGGEASNADWINARHAVEALEAAGLVVVERSDLKQLIDAYVMQAVR